MNGDFLTGLAGLNLVLGLAVALVLLLRGLVRRLFGARLAYALWLAVPIAGAACFLPGPMPSAVQGETESLSAPPIVQTAVNAAVDEVRALIPRNPVPADPAPVVRNPVVDLLFGVLIVFAWLIGVLISAGLAVWAQWRGVAQFGSMLKIPGADRVMRAASPEGGPAVLGVLFPRLVIPADFARRFDASERTLILAHERAHIASGDPLVNMAIVIFKCLCWFNPLIHIGGRYARMDQELACDAAVMRRFPAQRRRYAEALLKTQLSQAALPLGCHWPVRSPNLLKDRICTLSQLPPGPARAAAGALAVALLALGSGACAWAIQPPRLVLPPTFYALGTVTDLPPNVEAVSYRLPELPAARKEALFREAARTAGAARKAAPHADLTLGLAHIRELAGPDGRMTSRIPKSYGLDVLGSIRLAGGGAMGFDSTVSVDGDIRPITPRDIGSGQVYSSFTRYDVADDRKSVLVDKLMVIDGKPVMLKGMRARIGVMNTVRIEGGHTLSIMPVLRRMTDASFRGLPAAQRWAEHPNLGGPGFTTLIEPKAPRPAPFIFLRL